MKMTLLEYTTNWIKGELFEAKMIIGFGFLTSLTAFLFGKIGITPNAKALYIPLLVTGSIYLLIGGGMFYSNSKRTIEMPQRYQKDQLEFAKSEKRRVDDFQYGYKVSKIVATIFFLVTLIIFWSTKNPNWMGIGIGFSYFALAGLVVDYFSQERADLYYHAVLQALGTK